MPVVPISRVRGPTPTLPEVGETNLAMAAAMMHAEGRFFKEPKEAEPKPVEDAS